MSLLDTHTDAIVEQFCALPSWLAAALDKDQVLAALNQHVPEFASGALILRDCKIDLLNLKSTKGIWGRSWKLTIDGPDGEQRLPIRVELFSPGVSAPELPEKPQPFGSDEWSCWLTELRLLCRANPAKKAKKSLPALAQLTDSKRSREVLQQALREQAAGYEDVVICECTPKVLRDKPGSSAIIRYHLRYAAETTGRDWRDTIIAKAYDDDTGHNAFAGMTAVWQAGLKDSAAVRVAEPLAYLADQQATVQGLVPEERDLEKLLNALILSDDSADLEKLHAAFRAAGVALAALHRCGAQAEQCINWEDGFAEAAEQLTWLRVPFPDQIAAVDQLVEQLRTLEAAQPADAPVPSHGAFRPEQILLAGDQISIVDFDMFCMAEPAYDLALFRAIVMDNGLYDEDIHVAENAEVATRLERIDALNESFLAAYEAHAPVSRQRVALWEAIYYLNDTLQCWTKPRPGDDRLVVGVLERHLRELLSA